MRERYVHVHCPRYRETESSTIPEFQWKKAVCSTGLSLVVIEEFASAVRKEKVRVSQWKDDSEEETKEDIRISPSVLRVVVCISSIREPIWGS
jgi:hypothetical protein